MSGQTSENPHSGGQPRSSGGGTGHPQVDDAIAALAAVRDAPPAEQIGALAQTDRVLTEALDPIGDV